MPANRLLPINVMQGASMSNVRACLEDDVQAPDSDDDDYDVKEEDKMALCIRGIEYKIDINRVKPDPQHKLHRLALRWKQRSEKGQPRSAFYIDRNPDVLTYILDYNVTGELHLPDHICGMPLRKELAFWGIGEELIEPCCLWKTRKGAESADSMRSLQLAFKKTEGFAQNAKTWREKAWGLHVAPLRSPPGIVLYSCNMLFYLLFMLSLVFQTMTNFRSHVPGTFENATYESPRAFFVNNPLDRWLIDFDFSLLVLITCQICFWFVVCPMKKTYFWSVYDVISILSVFVQWLPVSVTMFCEPVPVWFMRYSMFTQGVKVARIIPIFHMLIPFKSMRVLAQALAASKRELLLLVVLIMVASVMFGYMAYVAEISIGGTHFKTLPDAFWWGMVTLTTIGYGDIYPQSSLGRFVGILCGISGIIVVALPIPIIAGNFTRIYDLMNVAEYKRRLMEMAECRKQRNMHQLNENIRPNDNGRKNENARPNQPAWFAPVRPVFVRLP